MEVRGKVINMFDKPLVTLRTKMVLLICENELQHQCYESRALYSPVESPDERNTIY